MTFYVLHWELRFSFEMKEHVLRLENKIEKQIILVPKKTKRVIRKGPLQVLGPFSVTSFLLQNCIFWGASFELIKNLATWFPKKLQGFHWALLYHCYTLAWPSHLKVDPFWGVFGSSKHPNVRARWLGWVFETQERKKESEWRKQLRDFITPSLKQTPLGSGTIWRLFWSNGLRLARGINKRKIIAEDEHCMEDTGAIWILSRSPLVPKLETMSGFHRCLWRERPNSATVMMHLRETLTAKLCFLEGLAILVSKAFVCCPVLDMSGGYGEHTGLGHELAGIALHPTNLNLNT